MASVVVRTLWACRASSIARASGTLVYQSSSLGRTCCIGGIEHGSRWSLIRLIGREFSRERRVCGAPRAPVPIAAASNRAAAVRDNESEEGEQDEDEPRKEKIGRNASKKQSARAKEWGRELAALSPAQLRQACKWASLDEDVYDAVMLVKNLGTSQKVKHGRRRQYNYIGGLLRDVDAEVMESVLKATKDGDVEGLVLIPSNQLDDVDGGFEDIFEDEIEDEEAEEEDDGVLPKAESWLEGLVAGDRAVEDEVYSIYGVHFDRQELRRLVREARRHETQSAPTLDAREGAKVEQELSEVQVSALRSRRERPQRTLLQFLLKIVKERRNNAYDTVVQ